MRKPSARSKTKNQAGGVRVRVVVLEHGEGLPLPAYQSDEAAGLDLVAAVGDGESIVIAPRKRALIPTGLSLELPKGFEGQVRPRSGLALKHGVTVLNSPGTIDSDYRGEVKIILINLGDTPFRVHRGERIAQLVVAPVTQVRLAQTQVLDATRRGKGGFGSTQAGTKRQPRQPSETPVAHKKSVKPKA
jgi:dUTP pyrophosphatase